MSRDRVAAFGRLALSGLLLWLLFRLGGVDAAGVAAIIRAARPGPLAGAFLCYAVLGSLVRGLRWRALVEALGQQISAWRSIALFLVGVFFNQLLPTGFGGDVVRSYMLGRDGLGAARAASTVVVDRAIGILLLLIVGLAAVVATIGRTPVAIAVPLLVSGVAGLAATLALFTGHRWRSGLTALPLFGRLLAARPVAHFVDSFADLGGRPLAVATAWSIVFTGMLIGANALTATALGAPRASLVDWCLVVPLVSLSGMLPSVGGWGVREWTYVGLLGRLLPNVSGDTAAAISVLFGLMNLVVAAVGWVVWVVDRRPEPGRRRV